MLFLALFGFVPALLSPQSPPTGPLNGPLHGQVVGEVEGMLFTDDGSHVVYIADEQDQQSSNGYGRLDLYAKPLLVDAPGVRLTTHGVEAIDVLTTDMVTITPDGSTVVYAHSTVPGYFRLYAVPIDGSEPPRPLGNPDHDIRETEFKVGPLGQYVYYQASSAGLFKAPIDGSAGAALIWPGTVASFKVSPDGLYCLFKGLQHLFLRRTDLTQPTLQLTLQEPEMEVLLDGWSFSPDSQYAVFATSDELFRAPTSTGMRAQLADHPLGATPTPDSQHVVFWRSFPGPDSGTWIVPIGGGTETRISQERPMSPFFTPPPAPRFSPDGTRFVFITSSITANANSLNVALLDGSADSILLNEGAHLFSNIRDFDFSPDSTWLVYYADQDVHTEYETYTVLLDGSGSPIQLNGKLPGLEILGFGISADGTRVAIRGSSGPSSSNGGQIRSAPIDGSSPSIPLVSGLQNSADVWGVSPQTTDVLYALNTNAAAVRGLFRVANTGGPAQALSGPMGTSHASVGNVFLPTGGERVVYTAHHQGDDAVALYSAPVDGSSPAVKLADGVSFSYLNPAGTHAVFVESQQAARNLISVPIDGSSAPVQLNTYPMRTFGGGSTTEVFWSFSGGGRILYEGRRPKGGVTLLSVPVDGLGPNLDIVGDPPHPTGIGRHQASESGGFVVVLCDLEEDNVFRHYSIATDGSSAPLPVFENGTLQEVAFDAHALILSDDVLHAVPVDGASPPIALTPAVPVDAYEDIGLTADKQHVFYVGRRNPSNSRRVFSVPVNGASSPVLHHGPFPFEASSQVDLQATPNSAWLVFTADPPEQGLYSASLSGSRGTVTLDLGEIQFALSSDSQHVVYSKRSASGSRELFFTRVDGQTDPTLVQGLAPTHDVKTFVVDPVRSGVVYSVGEVSSTAVEIYRAPFTGAPTPRLLLGNLLPDRTISFGPALAADGRVVFRSDLDAFGLRQLYSTPPSRRVSRTGEAQTNAGSRPIGPR